MYEDQKDVILFAMLVDVHPNVIQKIITLATKVVFTTHASLRRRENEGTRFGD
jgi:hypothetical protein